MAEWSNAHDSKSCYVGIRTEVRILFSAPSRHTQKERIKLHCVCLFLCKTTLYGAFLCYLPFLSFLYVVRSGFVSLHSYNFLKAYELHKKDFCTIRSVYELQFFHSLIFPVSLKQENTDYVSIVGFIL